MGEGGGTVLAYLKPRCPGLSDCKTEGVESESVKHFTFVFFFLFFNIFGGLGMVTGFSVWYKDLFLLRLPPGAFGLQRV